MAFELPPLPYAEDALEPYMGRETLQFHYGKHHNTYVTTLNSLVQDTDMAALDLESIVKKSFGNPDTQKIFNNAGQAWNHNHFWHWMKPNGGGAIPGELEKKIVEDFGSVDKMKDEFIQAGVGQFGSGWCWLVVDGGKLKVTKTPNGENPLAHGAGTAILGCDVWEHSYYLDYRNRRPDYLKAFVDNLVNWDYVAELYGKAS
ncbi:MAG: superoxide dismutase [Alphaproteobacteria bacterium]|jgi:Fe-Mn family superoxide dismutase|nr:superoxide dismutase [Alphaproteobacteria bacterium]